MNHCKKIFGLIPACLAVLSVSAQDTAGWSMRKCLDYAHSNSLQIKQSDLLIQESEYTKRQILSDLLPEIDVSASLGYSSQNIKNSMNEFMSDHSFNARYNLGGSFCLFNGMEQFNNLKKSNLNILLQKTNKEKTLFELDLSIIRIFTDIVYLKENVEVLKSALLSSKAQLELAAHKLDAGSISPSDYAQVAAQHSNSLYQLVCGQQQLNEKELKLKQLLELEAKENLEIQAFDADTGIFLSSLPDKELIYQRIIANLPDTRSQKISLQMAELDCRMASAHYWPTLSISASIGTGIWFDSEENPNIQLNDNLNENIGLHLQFPISNGWKNKISMQKAQLEKQQLALEINSREKELVYAIESLYNEVTAAQSRYMQAKAQLEAANASHRLIREQYQSGIKNTVELLLSSESCAKASQELLQAKYTAALAVILLRYYQGIPIDFL